MQTQTENDADSGKIYMLASTSTSIETRYDQILNLLIPTITILNGKYWVLKGFNSSTDLLKVFQGIIFIIRFFFKDPQSTVLDVCAARIIILINKK